MARYARTIASEARASESERERERPGVALRKGVNHWGCCAGPTDLFDFSPGFARGKSILEAILGVGALANWMFNEIESEYRAASQLSGEVR